MKSKKKKIDLNIESSSDDDDDDEVEPIKQTGTPTMPFDVFEKSLDKASITFTVVSKRNSGKSYMVKSMVRHLAPKYFSNIVVFSKTAHLTSDHSYTKNIINNFDEGTVKRILDYQQKRALKNKKLKEAKQKNISILMILDDTIGCVNENSKRTNHSDALDEVYSAGRHSKISLFQCSQFSSKISPCQRSNIDFLCIGVTSEDSLVKLHGVTVGKTYKEFREYIHANTKDHNFVLYNNLTTDDNERWTIIRAEANPKDFILTSKDVTKSKRSKQIQL